MGNAMDDDKLDRLYEQLTTQSHYVAGFCLAPATVVAFVLGERSLEERTAIKAHLETCRGCADDVQAVSAESAWVEQRLTSLRTQVLEQAGVPFGGQCPPLRALQAYFAGSIDGQTKSSIFGQLVERHMQSCESCRSLEVALRRNDAEFEIDFRDPGEAQAPSLADLLRKLVLTLRTQLATQPISSPVLAAGYRPAVGVLLKAPILDASGQLSLHDGALQTLQFHLIKSELAADGRLVLRFARQDEASGSMHVSDHELHAAIVVDGRRILLPPTRLSASGSITLIAKLPIDVVIRSIPESNIAIWVQASSD